MLINHLLHMLNKLVTVSDQLVKHLLCIFDNLSDKLVNHLLYMFNNLLSLSAQLVSHACLIL